MGSCPDAGKKNAFGIVQSPYVSCTVMHIESKQDTLRREFKTKKAALAFTDSLYCYKQTQYEGFSFLGEAKITGVKLDSIK